MICNSKSIILALALNASAVKINSMTKPGKVGKDGKDVLKVGEKGGKEVRIVEDDGLDISEAFSEMFPEPIEDAGRIPGEVYDMNFYTPVSTFEDAEVVIGNGPTGLYSAMSDLPTAR